jgi:hypothetical protein
MKNKIGISMIIIAGIHTIFGFVFFYEVWKEILKEGLFNTIGADPMRGVVIWFELYALPLFALGSTVYSLEKKSVQLPAHLFWYMVIILVTGVFFMPASGFWLLLFPLFLFWKKHSIMMSKNA